MTYRRSSATTGTFASRPTTAPEGAMFHCTDGPLKFIMSGGSWKPYLGSIPLITPPAASTWSLINATLNTTFMDWRGGLLFDGDCTTGTMLVAKIAAPATPYSITAHFLPTWNSTTNNIGSLNYGTAGICWRQISNGNLHLGGVVTATSITGVYGTIFRLLPASGTGSSGITYTNSTDFNFPNQLHQQSNHGVWIRGTDDGTNRIVSISGDGSVFKPVYSVTRTTSVTPDEVGIVVGNYATAGQTINPTTFFTSVQVG